MVLLFILMTLVVLAVAINLSEKVFWPRRNSKVTQKSVYENTIHFHKNRNKYYKFLKNNTYLLGCFMNHLQNKKKKRNPRIKNREQCEKKNDNIIPWPKD
ncbi:hypothetical protein [Clostridium thailandense]|uniref:hypothetical protein n=1 Tax=Clostridium thailandense TaxID=2794346 RepID=UPI003989DF7D